ncbi:MAG: hypothetical protein IKT41_00125 [Clostridia bacterium]|nr:hypothetical protein [Clostridia bacterium]
MKIKYNKRILRNIIIIFVAIIAIIGILKLAPNYKKDEYENRINLIINNNNVTGNVKKEIIIDENGIIYLSKQDIANFFDKYIYYDNKENTNEKTYNQIITTSDTKVAVLKLNENKIAINGADFETTGCAKIINETIYLPFSEMEKIYNIDIDYIEKTGIIIVESLDRELTKANSNKNISIKLKKTLFSRTVDKIKKGESITVISRNNGWAKVRTDLGYIGFVKENKLGDNITIREKLDYSNKIDGKINLVWDYYSEYVTAPNREGTKIEGINVVSPSFFVLEKLGKGEIIDNVGNSGREYIKWAKEENYKIWAMISNNSMPQTTSEIMRDYYLREKLINEILDLAYKYDLDGINIDFENMYEEDKDLFSRFIIELAPRLKEMNLVLSVDVTAPDGSPMWSGCFERNVIGYVSDYIIFMAYDQHNDSSTKAGTTAGYDWIEVALNKFVGVQEDVDSEKIILGIPFYTRLWKENGNKLLSSIVNMNDVEDVLPEGVEKVWNDELKQNYVEYENSGITYKMWIEDLDSIREKVRLVQKYDLAGVAAWEKDREDEKVWSVINEELNK